MDHLWVRLIGALLFFFLSYSLVNENGQRKVVIFPIFPLVVSTFTRGYIKSIQIWSNPVNLQTMALYGFVLWTCQVESGNDTPSIFGHVLTFPKKSGNSMCDVRFYKMVQDVAHPKPRRASRCGYPCASDSRPGCFCFSVFKWQTDNNLEYVYNTLKDKKTVIWSYFFVWTWIVNSFLFFLVTSF